MASITINWTAAPGTISGYNVRRGIGLGNESPVPLNASLIPFGTLTYTDTTAALGTTYSYSVTSVFNGVESQPSQELKSAPFPASPAPLNFGAASSFGVLATTAITNTGATTVTGDIGVSPSGAITLGGLTFTGVEHTNDSVSLAAQAAASAAFTAGNSLTPTGALAGAIGGTTTITTGVYNQASSVGITGILTLDAQGDPNAVFVFIIGTTLTTATGASVLLINGAQAANVFWLVGSSATLGTSTAFAGNIIANTSISVTGGAGATVNGKLIALGAAVTFSAITVVDTSIFGFATTGRFRYYDFSTAYALGDFLFQDSLGHLQQCVVPGTSGTLIPIFSNVIGGTTTDGSVTWLTVDPLSVAVLTPTVVGAPPGTPGPLS